MTQIVRCDRCGNDCASDGADGSIRVLQISVNRDKDMPIGWGHLASDLCPSCAHEYKYFLTRAPVRDKSSGEES